jgi:hypothetical protein
MARSQLGNGAALIPPDASPETADWERYTAITTKRPWDAKRFFDGETNRLRHRWQRLYVHLLTGLHVVTTRSATIYATGGIRYWHDGRDVADVTLALLDYPKTEKHRVHLALG